MTSLARIILACILSFVVSPKALAQTDPVLNESIRTLYFEDLIYPLAARVSHVQGVVVVKARLDDRGRVVSAKAVSGSKALIADCLSNSRKWRFEPNRDKSVVIIYTFKFEGLCNLPCASQFRFEPPNSVTITMGTPVIDHPVQ